MLMGGMPNLQGGRAANADDIVKRSFVEKSACSAAQGAPGFVCDFRWGQKQPDGNVQYGSPIKGRFFMTGDGWAVDLDQR